MTTEELNMAVFDKMSDEMQTYANHLKTLSPEEILNQCREYVTKFDILSVMETMELPDDKARALLATKSPLDAVYLHYDTKEVNYLDGISDAIKDVAEQTAEEKRSSADVPVYPHSLRHAKDTGMVDLYIRSHKLNIACKDEIESSIKDFYRNNVLDDEAVKRVVDKFGLARTMFVLACTLQFKQWDSRFSSENRSFTASTKISPDENMLGENGRLEYVVNSHSGLTNIFMDCVRRSYFQKDQQEKQPQRVKPSIRERIKTPAPKKNSPNYSANKKGLDR